MKLIKGSFLTKLIGVFRFLLVRLFFARKFTAKGLGIIPSNVIFMIPGNGRITFGKKVILSNNVEIQSSGILEIGSNTTINRYSRVISFDKISLGNNVTIAQFVTIVDHDHQYEMEGGNLKLDGYNTSPIRIGNNVWLADKCTVLQGVTIGNNVIAGAHTLINKDVPPNCIIGGVPFKIIKQLK